MARWGMVINLAKCTRCHACVAACRIEHFLPLRVTWPRLIALEVDEGYNVDVSTYPVRCNQCKDAPCVDACPTEASHKREDGIVAIDSDKCFGCRYCVIACPYQNRTYLSRKQEPGLLPRATRRPRSRRRARSSTRISVGTTEKCNFCLERIDEGLREGPQAGHRPRRHSGLRQHLPGPGPHLRRPGRSQQQRLQAHPREERLRAPPGVRHRPVRLLHRLQAGRQRQQGPGRSADGQPHPASEHGLRAEQAEARGEAREASLAKKSE